jgi:actin-like ATPase involved in cell morphogenesis
MATRSSVILSSPIGGGSVAIAVSSVAGVVKSASSFEAGAHDVRDTTHKTLNKIAVTLFKDSHFLLFRH